MTTTIWWIRRDLRLEHNPALEAAFEGAERVVPVFVLDPALLASPYTSPRRLAFLLRGLSKLDEALRERGSRLVVRRGAPEPELRRLVQETGASAIYCEQDVSPYGRARDRKVAGTLPLRGVWGLSYLSPKRALKPDGSPYSRFGGYRRAWHRDVERRARASRSGPPSSLPPVGDLQSESLPLDGSGGAPMFEAGEKAALRQLARFLDRGIGTYDVDRNRLDRDGTSKLSPYLRFGMISAERAVSAAIDAVAAASDERERSAAERWLDELIWREFYISVLYHFPRARTESFRAGGRFVRWRDDEDGFAAWCAGETGYPVVDAGMRELSRTGFIHNRVRMVTASFLTKHLLIDWRRGERWFMQQLVDGDPAANNGGWQWTAGTGTDAAPYFRVFNPELQGKRFDPEGHYVTRWLPELAKRARGEAHRAVRPIVSHTEARVRARKAFEEAQRRADEVS